MDQEERNGHHDEGVHEARVAWDAREALGTTRQLEAHDAVNVEHDDADDLGKAERDDGQVVTLEAQRRHTYDDASNGGHDATKEDAAHEEGASGRRGGHEVPHTDAKDGHEAHDEDGAGVASY